MSPARYRILTESLIRDISNGTYPIGAKLPTEEQLCRDHGMARGTVRLALGRLEQLGLIDRRAGAGTTVISRRPVTPYQAFAQTADDIAAVANETRLVEIETNDLVLDSRTAKRLGSRAGQPWFLLQGLRVRRDSDDIPLCWSEHYQRADLPHESLMHPTWTVADVEHHSIEQVISAEPMDENIATRLGVVAGEPALVVTRRHRDKAGRLISVGIHTHPGHRYRITTQLGPKAATDK
jgi:DNA-binding GntR family transcriptional regulator